VMDFGRAHPQISLVDQMGNMPLASQAIVSCRLSSPRDTKKAAEGECRCLL
jgi:hypothetical protein